MIESDHPPGERRGRHTRLMPLLLCLLAGALTTWFTLTRMQHTAALRGHSELRIKLDKLQESMAITVTRNQAMGVALLLGLNEPLLKQAARGELALDAPELLRRLAIARRQFDFEGIYVIDPNGMIRANDTELARSTGKQVDFRPYFQTALRGDEGVYMAIGTNSDSRGLFVAAPIRATTDKASEIIGVVAIKQSAEAPLDKLLNSLGSDALLLSPQGVVFAATRPEWELAITPPASSERIQAVRQLQQFGRRFAEATPAELGFDPLQAAMQLNGADFIAEHTTIDWNDPAGPWHAVLLDDTAKWLPPQRSLRVACLMLLATLALGLIAQQQRNRTYRLKRRLAAENAERTKAQEQMVAAAEERALGAKVAAELRQAHDLNELVQTFAQYAGALFDIRHLLFYVAHPAQQTLKLVGGYGVPRADIGRELGFGEGLAGQCAREQKPLQLANPPADYLRVTSGTGAATPSAILLRPLLLKGKLVGVVEAAAFSPLTDKQEKLLLEFETITAAHIELIQQRLSLEQEFLRQKGAEVRLRHQSALLQALLDTIPYPIFYKDIDSRFLGVNRAYEQTFNIRGADLIGKRVLDLEYLPEADRIAYQAEDERVIANQESVQREMLIPFADGSFHNTLYCVSGFQLGTGKQGGLVGIFIDINKRITED